MLVLDFLKKPILVHIGIHELLFYWEEGHYLGATQGVIMCISIFWSRNVPDSFTPQAKKNR